MKLNPTFISLLRDIDKITKDPINYYLNTQDNQGKPICKRKGIPMLELEENDFRNALQLIKTYKPKNTNLIEHYQDELDKWKDRPSQYYKFQNPDWFIRGATNNASSGMRRGESFWSRDPKVRSKNKRRQICDWDEKQYEPFQDFYDYYHPISNYLQAISTYQSSINLLENLDLSEIEEKISTYQQQEEN